ncbi:AraC family transcriptional regulator [Actinoplanes friuliensis]|uniref:HTH-type transcriptional regulator RipA n=1 Tax=Actinoplanes friuliensis DSM 7358 TaxID=1246995 RepID=U5W3N5_9ACTN|nr:AraC family transcriptional regulator [Actinoplanes friuliensis]AGZ43744.1 AraC family transcriptional regulator [Actinoplanes friuliensis DSM 7358]
MSPVPSLILSIDRGESGPRDDFGTHVHPEPLLLWTWTATVLVTAAERDWLVPPGHGLWVPGDVEHSGAVLRGGAGSALVFDPATCPVAWPRPTGVSGGPLVQALITHLFETDPGDPDRVHAEALLFSRLTPLPPHDLHVTLPADPRIRVIAERLIADPADPRDLAAWADHTHAGLRTLSRLFQNETGLSFARWRTRVRVRAAIPLLAAGATVDSVARQVGYRKTSAFIAAFRRVTGQTPGTYLQA